MEPNSEEKILTIVIPVYNEGKNIKIAVQKIEELVKYPHETYLIYDNEDDTTLEAARGLRCKLIKNKYGRGALNAIKTGLEAANTKYAAVTMADLSDPPEVINEMVKNAEVTGADIVCGSRYMKGGSQTNGPFIKGLLSRFAGLSLYYFTGVKTHDATNSFKLYRKSFLKEVEIQSTGGFELGLELVVKAHKTGKKVTEVPSHWTDRQFGKSNFKLMKWLPCYLKWYLSAFSPIFYYFLLAVLFFASFSPFCAQAASPLDKSWVWALNTIASGNEYLFGRNVFFTYGPLGYLFMPDSATLLQGIAFNFLPGILLVFFFYAIRKKPRALFLLVFFTIFYLMGMRSFEICAPLLAYICLTAKKRKLQAYALLGTASGIIFFTKFNFGVSYTATLFIALMLDKFNKKAAAASLIPFFTIILSFYFFYFGGLDTFLNWLSTTIEISSGYSEAMSCVINNYLEHRYLFLAALFTIACGFIMFYRENKLKSAKLAVLFLPFLFFSYKTSFTRADIHHIVAVFVSFFYLLPFLYFVREKFHILHLVVLEAALLLLLNFGFKLNVPIFSFKKNDFSAGDTYILPETWVKTIGNSTVEALPYDMLYIIKNKLRPHFNPILQLYSVYTEKLDKISAESYVSGPDFIIFSSLDSPDNRSPFYDSPATIRAIKENYLPVDSYNGIILLKKREKPQKEIKKILFDKNYAINEEINVPEEASGAAVDIRLSRTGKITKFLYKIIPVKFRIIKQNSGENKGHSATLNIIRPQNSSLLDENLYVESFVENTDDLYKYLNGETGSKPIFKIAFKTNSPFLYQKIIKIRWFKRTD